jgi:hypothetical protein
MQDLKPRSQRSNPPKSILQRCQMAIRHMWDIYQWLIIGAAWFIGLCLGYVGFAKYFTLAGETATFWDLLYLTLQLTSMNSGAVPGPISWELNVSRLMIPALAAITLFKALALLFKTQMDLVRLRLIRNHIIICGLSRKGVLLVDSFRERGDQVVVIERDASHERIEQCRLRGALVVIGDGRDQEILSKAGIARAKYLISVCEDDSVNAEVAMIAEKMVEGRRVDPLNCFIHIVDRQLCDLLKIREIGLGNDQAFRLELFNIYERGARLLLQEYLVFNDQELDTKKRWHFVLVGMGRMGESLILQAAKNLKEMYPGEEKLLRVTVIDRDAFSKCESMQARYTKLYKVCDIKPWAIEIPSPVFYRLDFLNSPSELSSVDFIVICLDNDSLNLFAGLTLVNITRDAQIPIVVRVAEEGGIATLLEKDPEVSNLYANLFSFELLNKTCTPDLLLGGTHEILAQALHEEYVYHQLQNGVTSKTNPVMIPWENLSEEMKESNRQQVDRIGLKLKPYNVKSPCKRIGIPPCSSFPQMKSKKWPKWNMRIG